MIVFMLYSIVSAIPENETNAIVLSSMLFAFLDKEINTRY